MCATHSDGGKRVCGVCVCVCVCVCVFAFVCVRMRVRVYGHARAIGRVHSYLKEIIKHLYIHFFSFSSQNYVVGLAMASSVLSLCLESRASHHNVCSASKLYLEELAVAPLGVALKVCGSFRTNSCMLR